MTLFIKENKFGIILSLFLILILGLVFYWFYYRPAIIEKYCYDQVKILKQVDIMNQQNSINKYNNDEYFSLMYISCLSEQGYEESLKSHISSFIN